MTMFFFFQAEDGIRDLVRSRGLGDVYKRQVFIVPHAPTKKGAPDSQLISTANLLPLLLFTPRLEPNLAPHVVTEQAASLIAVSYTHLTLPTSDLV